MRSAVVVAALYSHLLIVAVYSKRARPPFSLLRFGTRRDPIGAAGLSYMSPRPIISSIIFVDPPAAVHLPKYFMLIFCSSWLLLIAYFYLVA
jgi:hypothetical protein